MRFIRGFIWALILLILAAAAIIISGFYNVAATQADPGIVQWLLGFTKDRSVSRHAGGGTAPAALTDAQARDGFRFYNEACIYCHGAPGKDPTDIGKGLNPEPPFLPDVAKRWTSAELFWIVKNGIKMTGMPAFGPTHKDEEIWNAVAFVQRLPKMSAEQFSALEQNPTAAPLPAP
jgi:mono/diheme cytochrome c family protein